MCVALHPYWVGQPHRTRAICSAFEYILSCPGVWQTTGEVDRRLVQRELSAADRVRTWPPGRPPMAEFTPAKIPPVSESREPGMDHAHYSFRALPDAPRFVWPGGARIAFTVTLVLDYWELAPPDDESPDPRIVSPLGKFLSGLADLESSALWRPRWDLPHSGRAGSIRSEAQCRVGNAKPRSVIRNWSTRCLRRDACFMAHGDYASRRITSRMGTNERDSSRPPAMDSPPQSDKRPKAGADRTSTNRRTRPRF